MLSISIVSLRVCSAYAFAYYAHAENTSKLSTRWISLSLDFLRVDSVNAKTAREKCHFLSVCSDNAYTYYAFAQNKISIVRRMLSVSLDSLSVCS
jgi:hypothetical protein